MSSLESKVGSVLRTAKARGKVISSKLMNIGAAPWPQNALVTMEVCGYCNMRCPMCSHPNLSRPKGFMEWELFAKVVNDAAENGDRIVTLHFFGEPLMWPHIVEGVKLLSSKNLFPCISTNGILFKPELARQLQDAGLKEIMVTIDTLIPEAYRQIRVGGDFETVKRSIHEALDAAPNLLISAQFMPTKYNRGETEEDFYREFGRHPNFKLESWFTVRMNNTCEYIGQGVSYNPAEIDKRLCDKLFSKVHVLWDGTTVLCCLDPEGTLVTGNMNNNTLAYSWLGPKAMEIRRKILKGQWQELTACRTCSADHIVKKFENWHLTNPPAILPKGLRKQLDWLERLEAFDEKTRKWTLRKI